MCKNICLEEFMQPTTSVRNNNHYYGQEVEDEELPPYDELGEDEEGDVQEGI